jgi:catechol 2,3-dioxygenase-like lactoylglutathione lyase family enzyme
VNTILVTKTHFILYVKDQGRSTAFYSQVLGCQPSLNVPGMTEFTFSENVTLGLMPENSIKRLLGDKLPNPSRSTRFPRCEIYLLVSHPFDYHRRAIEAGAMELSGVENRDWGHRAAYSLDPDGHVLAFAEQIESESEPK